MFASVQNEMKCRLLPQAATRTKVKLKISTLTCQSNLKIVGTQLKDAMLRFVHTFYSLGKTVGGNPWITIFISLVVCGVCLIGVVRFTRENREDKMWVPPDSTAQRHRAWVQKNFPAKMRVSSVLIVADNVLTPEVMKEVRNQSSLYRSCHFMSTH